MSLSPSVSPQTACARTALLFGVRLPLCGRIRVLLGWSLPPTLLCRLRGKRKEEEKKKGMKAGQDGGEERHPRRNAKTPLFPVFPQKKKKLKKIWPTHEKLESDFYCWKLDYTQRTRLMFWSNHNKLVWIFFLCSIKIKSATHQYLMFGSLISL